MHIRPGFHVLFFILELILIGGHYAFPDLPHELGQTMFWAGIVGLVLWAAASFGAFDRFEFITRRLGPQKPRRDVTVGDAVAFVCLRIWGSHFWEAAGNSSTDAVAAVRDLQQAAADGLVPIWGLRRGSDVFEAIPHEYWLRHQIEWFGLLRDSATTEPRVSAADRGDTYLSLMTSRSTIEANWPRKRKRIRLQFPWRVTNA